MCGVGLMDKITNTLIHSPGRTASNKITDLFWLQGSWQIENTPQRIREHILKKKRSAFNLYHYHYRDFDISEPVAVHSHTYWLPRYIEGWTYISSLRRNIALQSASMLWARRHDCWHGEQPYAEPIKLTGDEFAEEFKRNLKLSIDSVNFAKLNWHTAKIVYYEDIAQLTAEQLWKYLGFRTQDFNNRSTEWPKSATGLDYTKLITNYHQLAKQQNRAWQTQIRQLENAVTDFQNIGRKTRLPRKKP